MGNVLLAGIFDEAKIKKETTALLVCGTMLMLVLVRVCHSVYRRASVRREPRAAFYVCKEASLPFYQ